MSWCSANGICWGSCRSTWTTTTGPGPTYRWPRTHPSHGVCSRRARAGWWRCPAWEGSITNTSGERREPIGRISGRHNPIGNGNKGTSPVAKHIFWPDGRFTYKDTFPHAKLTRSPEGVLEMVLHTNGDTLIFNGYTHEEFVKLFHQINQDAETRVVIPTGANEAFIDRIDAEGFDFFSPRGYDKIYREGKKALLNLIASLSRRRRRWSRASRTSLSASCRATASIRYGRRSLGRSAIARSCSLSS